MQEADFKKRICGVSCDGRGGAAVYVDSGGRRKRVRVPFEPFVWTASRAPLTPFESGREPLKGPDFAVLDAVVRFPDDAAANAFLKARDKSLPLEKLGCSENLFLARNSLRMFDGMTFGEIRIAELSVSVSDSPDTFGKIYAVALAGSGGFKILRARDFSDAAERELLEGLNSEIAALDPDIIVGHEIFRRDLAAVAARAKKLKLPLAWGRGGERAVFRKSRLKLAERSFGYVRCDIPGRTVADTSLMAQIYDVSVRGMASYSLKDCAEHFGIDPSAWRASFRLGGELDAFLNDFGKFESAARRKLEDCAKLADRLLPAYVAQVGNFPMTLQECLLRGSGAKVENLFLEKYLAASAALPLPSRSKYFEGALSESFALGIFKSVLHYDVASLYPSIMLMLGRCPKNDYLNVFVSELRRLREYRLKYKALAKSERDPALAREYDARQMSFKILINSFYGYLGLDNATFGDIALAEEVTRRGRELLGKIIGAFSELPGCKVLEADTDGIYVGSAEYFENPEGLLSKVLHVMPEGIDLEFDGAFDAMLCYKAKNYALLRGGEIILKGSAFKNRATEPLLRSLTAEMARSKLLGDSAGLGEKVGEARRAVLSGAADIDSISKSEYINKPVAQYLEEVRNGGMRRAPMEAAAMLSPHPEVGDRISYYIARGDGRRAPDWKNARPSAMYDPEKFPYDAGYYARKIDDWSRRFSDLISDGGQAELF